MKKILIIIASCLLLTGCFNDEDLNDVYIYTTIYPIEYITSNLYNEYANIKSVYPDGANTNEYTFTDKQKSRYASAKSFIYNGLSDEVPLAVDLLNLNYDLQIIDAMKGMNYTNSVEELWLDPSQFLMVARNINIGLKDYESNVYVKEKIEKNYDELKIKISELDVELTMTGKNANYHTIIVTDNLLKYLEKYNINVISLDPKNDNIDKAYADATKLAKSKDTIYIYNTSGNEMNEAITSFQKKYNLEVLTINTIKNITEEERKNSENYITLMSKNIDELKKELFK